MSAHTTINSRRSGTGSQLSSTSTSAAVAKAQPTHQCVKAPSPSQHPQMLAKHNDKQASTVSATAGSSNSSQHSKGRMVGAAGSSSSCNTAAVGVAVAMKSNCSSTLPSAQHKLLRESRPDRKAELEEAELVEETNISSKDRPCVPVKTTVSNNRASSSNSNSAAAPRSWSAVVLQHSGQQPSGSTKPLPGMRVLQQSLKHGSSIVNEG